jgi:hypothetical protein
MSLTTANENREAIFSRVSLRFLRVPTSADVSRRSRLNQSTRD